MNSKKLYQAFGLALPHNPGDPVQVQEEPYACRYWHIKEPGQPPSDVITLRDRKPKSMVYVYAYQDCVAYASKTHDYSALAWTMPQNLQRMVYVGSVYTLEELEELEAMDAVGLTVIPGHSLTTLKAAITEAGLSMVLVTPGYWRVIHDGDVVEPTNIGSLALEDPIEQDHWDEDFYDSGYYESEDEDGNPS